MTSTHWIKEALNKHCDSCYALKIQIQGLAQVVIDNMNHVAGNTNHKEG